MDFNKVDKLIAEKVFGGDRKEVEIKDFSTNIASAELVLNRMLEKLPQQDIHLEHLEGRGWSVSTCHEDVWKDFVSAETLPLAICLAALSLFSKQ